MEANIPRSEIGKKWTILLHQMRLYSAQNYTINKTELIMQTDFISSFIDNHKLCLCAYVGSAKAWMPSYCSVAVPTFGGCSGRALGLFYTHFALSRLLASVRAGWGEGACVSVLVPGGFNTYSFTVRFLLIFNKLCLSC